jgi:uncharacterized protein YdeI (YjbR/CyaY-like superfamily)
MPPVPARFFRSGSELRAWFESHHADTPELWVGFYKVHTGRRGVVYPEAVDEALCFGWIDTTVRRIDEDRYANRFVPRRPGSQWSAVNRRRFAELDRQGRIHEAGRQAFQRSPTASRPQFSSGGTYRFSPEYAGRLRDGATADRYFRSRPRGYRKRATFWVMSAARLETRERRFVTLLVASARATIPAALLLPGEVAPRPLDPRRRHRQRPAGRG